MRLIALAFALTIATGASAASIRLAVTGQQIIINKGEGHKHPLGDGRHHLDPPTSFTCNSAAGCLVTIQAMAGLSISQSRWKICSVVDGQPAEPTCPVQNEGNPLLRNTGNSLQNLEVAQGDHVVQTHLSVHLEPHGVEPGLLGWEVNYTIYDK